MSKTNLLQTLSKTTIAFLLDYVLSLFDRELASRSLLQIPYASFDIRISNFKISHVDANLFPAGFNNITNLMSGSKAFAALLGESKKRILIYPEKITRNKFYMESLQTLQEMIALAGHEARIATEDELFSSLIKIERIKRIDQKLYIASGSNLHDVDLILLNNDLSSGVPELLQELETPIIPSPAFGWYQRSKAQHFDCYQVTLHDCIKDANLPIDPWLFSCYHDFAAQVDFKTEEGFADLEAKVDELLRKIKAKYLEYDLLAQGYEPKVYIKSDFGTYGMSMMVVKDALELRSINKKIRNKMAISKNGIPNNKVIIQEAVITNQILDGNPAETMAYIVANQIIEVFYRANSKKDAISNLNSQGMYFQSQILHDGSKEELAIKSVVLMALLAIAKEATILPLRLQ